MISGGPIANPQRMPASPNALDSVWSTTTLLNSVTREVAEGVELKSMYASSTMTRPWYDGQDAR